MCRNIKTLFNFEPPATDDEIRDASLQFVRKVSGFNKPSKINEEVFCRAIEEIAAEMKVRTTAEVIALAEKRKGLEWQHTIKAIGKKPDAAACVFLVKCLKERNERERPVILDSLATWAGIDEKAEERQSQGAVLDAAEKKLAKLNSK